MSGLASTAAFQVRQHASVVPFAGLGDVTISAVEIICILGSGLQVTMSGLSFTLGGWWVFVEGLVEAAGKL